MIISQNLHTLSYGVPVVRMKRKTSITIYKNGSAPFHIDQFISDWTEKKHDYLIFDILLQIKGNFHFPCMPKTKELKTKMPSSRMPTAHLHGHLEGVSAQACVCLWVRSVSVHPPGQTSS